MKKVFISIIKTIIAIVLIPGFILYFCMMPMLWVLSFIVNYTDWNPFDLKHAISESNDSLKSEIKGIYSFYKSAVKDLINIFKKN